MTSDQIAGIIRALLAAAGGFIVAKGFVDDATWATVSGALVTVFTAVWSIWAKAQTAKATQAAVAAAAGSATTNK